MKLVYEKLALIYDVTIKYTRLKKGVIMIFFYEPIISSLRIGSIRSSGCQS